MELVVCAERGQPVLEGAPGQLLIGGAAEVNALLEECFANAASRLLLYAENLPERFFDLSTGEAGAILQKLRTYRVRLAIVSSPARQPSRLFGELVADERRGPDFRMFDERAHALAWLCAG